MGMTPPHATPGRQGTAGLWLGLPGAQVCAREPPGLRGAVRAPPRGPGGGGGGQGRILSRGCSCRAALPVPPPLRAPGPAPSHHLSVRACPGSPRPGRRIPGSRRRGGADPQARSAGSGCWAGRELQRAERPRGEGAARGAADRVCGISGARGGRRAQRLQRRPRSSRSPGRAFWKRPRKPRRSATLLWSPRHSPAVALPVRPRLSPLTRLAPPGRVGTKPPGGQWGQPL